jgi:HD-like signal output (HDOD) protein
VVGVDHTAIGEWIATRWNLPARLRDAILYHHKPLEALERAPGSFSLVKLVAIANAIAHMGSEGVPIEEVPARLDEMALSEAGLDAPCIAEILDAVQHEKREMRDILSPGDAR